MRVGGDVKPRSSGDAKRVPEAAPGAGRYVGAFGPTTARNHNSSGITKLFGEEKRQIGGASKSYARKSRKHGECKREADFDPRQHWLPITDRQSRLSQDLLVLRREIASMYWAGVKIAQRTSHEIPAYLDSSCGAHKILHTLAKPRLRGQRRAVTSQLLHGNFIHNTISIRSTYIGRTI